jgi:hypothetical protein
MPEIIAESNDGYQQSPLKAAWNDAHDNIGQGSPHTTATTYNFAIGATFASGRSSFFLRRAFFEFDTSGISVAPSAATLKLYVTSTSYDNSSLIAVKSGHDPSDATEDWYSSWLTGLGGSLAGWSNSDSEVVAYSSNVAAGMGAGYVDLTLNSDALSDMASLSSFKVVVMNYTNDYLDDSSSTEGFTGISFSEDGSLSRPKIDYTAGGPAPATTYDNIGDEQVIFSNTIVVSKGLIKF